MLSKMVARSFCLFKIFRLQISRNFDNYIVATKTNKRLKKGCVSELKGYVKHTNYVCSANVHSILRKFGMNEILISYS